MPHQDFLDLFKEDTGAVSMLKGDADALKATKKALEHALVRYQDGEPQTNAEDKTPYWDFLRRHLSPEQDFAIILALASRHSLAWTNQFIESLVQYNVDTQMFTVNTNRLKTLIFLQKHCGLQSRDLSVTTSPYTLPEDVRLFERPIEGETFNPALLDDVYAFLKKLENSEAMNWAMYLVKQGFLNFSMLHKKIALEKEAFLDWLTQWAQRCQLEKDMKAENALDISYKSDDGLTQRTIRHMVRYGLSPKWLQEKAALSINEATGTTLNTTVASNVTFDSALEYHQSPEVNVYQNTGHAPLEQPSIDDATSNINNTTPEWLKTYTNPEDQYILYRLKEALSLNKEPALERLKFYHDHHRLSRLIDLVKQGQLSFAEIAEYDKPPIYSTKENKHEYGDEGRDRFKQDYNYISRLMVVEPRKLPRLLVRFTDEDVVSFSQSEMAHYDMLDYNPKNNPTRKITMPKRPHLQKMFEAHEEYLDNVFNRLILPIAEERARLYREWHRLNKKVIDNPAAEHSAGFFCCFHKTPRQEMTLIEEKIELLSGFLREQCANLKALELKVADHKREGKLPPKKFLYPERIEHYRIQFCIKRRNKTHLDGALQLDPFYHQELRGIISASDLNINHTKNDSIGRIRVVTDEARDSVGSFLKATIGAFLVIPAIVVATVTAFQVKACSLKTFYGHFFRTQSHQAICKAEETAAELIEKRKASEDGLRTAAEQEARDPSSAPLVAL